MHLLDTIAYLEHGNPKQQAAYAVLASHHIMQVLKDFTPILAGTIPIAIAIENSDLDILCFYKDAAAFTETLTAAFSGYKNYTLTALSINGIPTVIAGFYIDDFEFEVFGQPIPVQEQNGYRHMIIEYDILNEKGETFRQEIIRLKQQGYKTEPAFAKLLGLEGDPYQALLDYADGKKQ